MRVWPHHKLLGQLDKSYKARLWLAVSKSVCGYNWPANGNKNLGRKSSGKHRTHFIKAGHRQWDLPDQSQNTSNQEQNVHRSKTLRLSSETQTQIQGLTETKKGRLPKAKIDFNLSSMQMFSKRKEISTDHFTFDHFTEKIKICKTQAKSYNQMHTCALC